MKAVVFHETGGPEVLRYEEVATPTPGPGEVLLQVKTSSLNRGVDSIVRSGAFGMGGIELPHITGSDPAGVVQELGEGVSGFEVGDRVVAYSGLPCGSCDFCKAGAGENYCRNFRILGVHVWGGHAEALVIPAANLIPLPNSVTYAQASALAVAYVTTWHGMFTQADTRAGDTLLVTSASSGLGAAAIQLAKQRGVRVTAVTSENWKMERALEIGADAVVDGAQPNWTEEALNANDGKRYSVVFDNVGTPTYADSVQLLLDRNGRAFCSGAIAGFEVKLDIRVLYRNMPTLHFNMYGTSEELRQLVDLVDKGELNPVIDSAFHLSDAVAAEQHMAGRRQFGKIILTTEDPEQIELSLKGRRE